MNNFRTNFIFLLCCVFGSKMAVELDQKTRLLATYGQYKPSNLDLKKGEPITVPWEGNSGFKPVTNLDLQSCKGSVDKGTFSKLPDVQLIHFSGSHIDHLYPGAFSTLNQLETIGVDGFINFEQSDDSVGTTPLPKFQHLNFHFATLKGLNKNVLYDLSSLTRLKIDNSEMSGTTSDAFADLKNITELSIKTTKVSDFDFSQILKLKTLKYLGIHDLETNSTIDFNMFRSLPNLETILFDTLAYRELDFAGFPNLKTVEVGLGDTRDKTILNDNDVFHAVMDRVEALKSKGIESKIVYAGKDRIVGLL